MWERIRRLGGQRLAEVGEGLCLPSTEPLTQPSPHGRGLLTRPNPLAFFNKGSHPLGLILGRGEDLENPALHQ